jgi:RNA polymerase sigma factor (sigma-70 family)
MTRTARDEPGAVVRRAAEGDQRAWRELVASYEPLLRSVARSFRLSSADADDVVQETWVRLHRSLDRLENPDAVGGWLVTTIRRQALRALQREVRETPQSEVHPAGGADVPDPPEAVAQMEREQVVRAAVQRLGERQRAVMNALLGEPDLSYHVLGRRLGMPVGSIGPTRGRAIERLRRDPQLTAVLSDPVRHHEREADVLRLAAVPVP